jgi:hypothetical protein
MANVIHRYSRKGVDLATWLHNPANLAKICNMRILYVVKSNSHRGVFKYGVAGFSSRAKTDARGRLHSYVVQYGPKGDLNMCAEVRLYYLEASKKAPNVKKVDSQIYKRERLLVAGLSQYKMSERGIERVRTTFRNISRILGSPRYTAISDKVTIPKRSARVAARVAAKAVPLPKRRTRRRPVRYGFQ